MKKGVEFESNNKPQIYAYQDERFTGCLKIGYTTKSAQERVREQYPTKTPHQSWEILLEELALRDDETFFTDHEIHRRLSQMGIIRENGEWFRCSLNDVKAAILAEKKGIKENPDKRTQDFGMRPEQKEAVEKTAQYFTEVAQDGYTPHFLWNAKMRFGKTFATYQLTLKMGWKKVLILTFKPAVLSAWRDDLKNHIDFQDWQFVSKKDEDLKPENID